MPSYTIKSETADKIRAYAPALGLQASQERDVIGPGLERLHLSEFAALKFDEMRKRAKVSPDVLIGRLIKVA
jgi:hypothetical protein